VNLDRWAETYLLRNSLDGSKRLNNKVIVVIVGLECLSCPAGILVG